MTPIHESSKTAAEDSEFEHSLIAAIQEASPDGILVVDEKDVIVTHNQRLFDVLGIAPEQIPGCRDGRLHGLPDQPLLSRFTDTVKDREEFQRLVRALYADPQLEDHCEVALKDGRTLERYSAALWGAGCRYIGRVWFFRDITVRKDVEQALQELSLRDPLTGIANRRHFSARAAEEFARARRFGRELSLIMVDIDRFKAINDRWGHAAGDRVLKNLCAGAQAVLRQEDLFARIGGEEFAVLAPDTNLDGAFHLAERLRQQVMAQAVPEGRDAIAYTVSAGVATLTAADASIDAVLCRADGALYAAKRAGRNRTLRSGDTAMAGE